MTQSQGGLLTYTTHKPEENFTPVQKSGFEAKFLLSSVSRRRQECSSFNLSFTMWMSGIILGVVAAPEKLSVGCTMLILNSPIIHSVITSSVSEISFTTILLQCEFWMCGFIGWNSSIRIRVPKMQMPVSTARNIGSFLTRERNKQFWRIIHFVYFRHL